MSNDTEKRKIKLSMEVNNEECDIVTHLNKNMVTDALDYIPIDEEEKGASPGVAELDETGKLPKDQLPPEATDVIIGYYNGGHFWKNKVGSAGSYQYSNMIMADSAKIYLDIGESLKWELYAYNDDNEAYVKITNKVEWEETVLETLNKLCVWYDSDNRIDTIYENDKPLQAQNHKVYTKNTTYSNMKKATDSAAGTSGLVPAPAAGDQNKFLRGDATWAIPSEAGKLSTARTIDGVKFDGSKNISHLGNCSSGENTVNKVVTCDGFVLSKGARITVIFSYTNKADDITLNVNNTGAKPVYYNASAMKSSNLRINADRAYDFVYDGTNWVHCGTVHYTAQNNTVENKKKRLLLSPTDTNDNEVYVTHKSENFTANPATGSLNSTTFETNVTDDGRHTKMTGVSYELYMGESEDSDGGICYYDGLGASLGFIGAHTNAGVIDYYYFGDANGDPILKVTSDKKLTIDNARMKVIQCTRMNGINSGYVLATIYVGAEKTTTVNHNQIFDYDLLLFKFKSSFAMSSYFDVVVPMKYIYRFDSYNIYANMPHLTADENGTRITGYDTSILITKISETEIEITAENEGIHAALGEIIIMTI